MKKITSLVASVSALLLITSCSHEADFDSTELRKEVRRN